MKKQLKRHRFCGVVITLIVSYTSIAQPSSMKGSLNNQCAQLPLGLFRQLTGSPVNLSEEFNNTIWVNKESDIKENRWTLNPLDEVDSAYKFLILRNEFIDAEEKCGDIIAVKGKLISPTGKLFEFKQATYEFPSRKLKFTTIERDGIVYDGNIQFYSKAIRVGGFYQEGTVKLKAAGKVLGTVSMEFSFESVGSE